MEKILSGYGFEDMTKATSASPNLRASLHVPTDIVTLRGGMYRDSVDAVNFSTG